MATRTREGVSAVMGDVPQLDGQFDHLIHDRVRVVPNEGGVAGVAVGRLVVEDLVGGEDRAFVFGVSRLSAPRLAGRRWGGCGLDVRPVRRGRFRRVGRVLVEAGFEIGEASFEGADVRLDCRGQGVKHVRG